MLYASPFLKRMANKQRPTGKGKPMKLTLAFGLALLVLAQSNAGAAQSSETRIANLVAMETINIYAPKGISNKDNAHILIEAGLPNTCYEAAFPKFEVDLENLKIYVTAQAYHYVGIFCGSIFRTYTQDIELGILPEGNYDVIDVDAPKGSQRRAVLPIASSEP